MKKILKAAGHLRRMLAEGLPKVNEEWVRRELLKDGMRKKDIDIALQLMACIAVLDEKIFGKRPAVFSFAPCQELGETLAQYIFVEDKRRKSGAKETYEVFAEGLAEVWEDPSPMEIIAIAAHEVRHRLQQHRLVKLLRPKDIENCDDKYLAEALEIVDSMVKEEKKAYILEKRPRDYVRSRLNPGEFDARVVEEVIRNRTFDGCRPEELCEIIRIQV